MFSINFLDGERVPSTDTFDDTSRTKHWKLWVLGLALWWPSCAGRALWWQRWRTPTGSAAERGVAPVVLHAVEVSHGVLALCFLRLDFASCDQSCCCCRLLRCKPYNRMSPPAVRRWSSVAAAAAAAAAAATASSSEFCVCCVCLWER